MIKKILIVEDERDMRQALVDELSRNGFETLEAKNGREGLESVQKDHPDLILLDIVMPEMDGMTMMQKLRENVEGKKIPIILLTNLNATDKIIEGVVRDEPSYYLVKSDWNIEGVVAKVKEMLNA